MKTRHSICWKVGSWGQKFKSMCKWIYWRCGSI